MKRSEKQQLLKAEDGARLRRNRETEEWHITGERASRPKKRHYLNGGGVPGVDRFLASTDRALHLYDRGKALTTEMSAVMSDLGRREAALQLACKQYADKHASHEHPERLKDGKWQVGSEELRLFVAAADRMTPRQREAFTDVLAPLRDKSKEVIGPLESLKTRLQRAKNASAEQAASGELYGAGPLGQQRGRFTRYRAAKPTCSLAESLPPVRAVNTDG